MRPSELQMYYQWNMLIGLCIATLLSIGCGVALYVLDGQGADQTFDNGVVTVVTTRDTSTVADGNQVVGYVAGSLNPYATQHQGFLGFVNLRPEQSLLEPIALPPPIFSDDMGPDGLYDTAIWSLSPDESADTGVHIPLNVDFIASQYDDEPAPALVNRGVRVAVRVDPEYPFVAKDTDKEGEITILIYIDSTGELTTFPDWIQGEGIQTLEFTVNGRDKSINYAVREDPPGWYFADNFLKVLPQWKFSPRIENSRPVPALLRIKYYFCLGVNCSKYELIPVPS